MRLLFQMNNLLKVQETTHCIFNKSSIVLLQGGTVSWPGYKKNASFKNWSIFQLQIIKKMKFHLWKNMHCFSFFFSMNNWTFKFFDITKKISTMEWSSLLIQLQVCTFSGYFSCSFSKIYRNVKVQKISK